MKRQASVVTVLRFATVLAATAQPVESGGDLLDPYTEASKKKWAKAIATFAELDAANTYATNNSTYARFPT